MNKVDIYPRKKKFKTEQNKTKTRKKDKSVVVELLQPLTIIIHRQDRVDGPGVVDSAILVLEQRITLSILMTPIISLNIRKTFSTIHN